MKNYITMGLILVVLVLGVVQAFQISSLKSDISNIQGNAVQGSGLLDMSGWTADEVMMYEYHGILPARLGNAQVASSSDSMVGGC